MSAAASSDRGSAPDARPSAPAAAGGKLAQQSRRSQLVRRGHRLDRGGRSSAAPLLGSRSGVGAVLAELLPRDRADLDERLPRGRSGERKPPASSPAGRAAVARSRSDTGPRCPGHIPAVQAPRTGLASQWRLVPAALGGRIETAGRKGATQPAATGGSRDIASPIIYMLKTRKTRAESRYAKRMAMDQNALRESWVARPARIISGDIGSTTPCGPPSPARAGVPVVR